MRPVLGVHWKDWCWSWNSSTLATSCKELTQWKRCWCWEGLGAGGEGDDRGWDGWMASPTRRTWIWVNYRSWRWTGRPGVLRFMGSQRIGHDRATELNWRDSSLIKSFEKTQISFQRGELTFTMHPLQTMIDSLHTMFNLTLCNSHISKNLIPIL